MRALLGLLLAAAVVAQQPSERYPGQSEHREPPPGWTCVHQNFELSVPPEHACSCEHMCDERTGQVLEDRNCATWCWPKSCQCPVGNSSACR
jgi:hypothetical protein